MLSLPEQYEAYALRYGSTQTNKAKSSRKWLQALGRLFWPPMQSICTRKWNVIGPYWVFTDLEGKYKGYPLLASRPDVAVVAGHDREVMTGLKAVDEDCLDLSSARKTWGH